jgi:hypothetical protein
MKSVRRGDTSRPYGQLSILLVVALGHGERMDCLLNGLRTQKKATPSSLFQPVRDGRPIPLVLQRPSPLAPHPRRDRPPVPAMPGGS